MMYYVLVMCLGADGVPDFPALIDSGPDFLAMAGEEAWAWNLSRDLAGIAGVRPRDTAVFDSEGRFIVGSSIADGRIHALRKWNEDLDSRVGGCGKPSGIVAEALQTLLTDHERRHAAGVARLLTHKLQREVRAAQAS